MIIDCYTHFWESPAQLGRCVPLRGSGDADEDSKTGAIPPADAGRHWRAAEPAHVTFVLGFRSHYMGAHLSNEQVAQYVAQHPEKLIGFAGVDPSSPREAVADLEHARLDLGLRGLAVAPAAQDVHPSNSQAMLVYAEAVRHAMPILFDVGVYLAAASKLEYAHPALLDEVARELPQLKMVIAHLGYPWVDETLVLLEKHANVYAEVSRVLDKPWQAYRSLLAAHECGVIDKVLFGSGFPHGDVASCVERLYGVNQLCHDSGLPTIPREKLRGIVERDSLSLLGIPAPPASPSSRPQAPPPRHAPVA